MPNPKPAKLPTTQRTKTLRYDPPQKLIDLLNDIYADGTASYTEPKEDGETFVLCLVCGEWEGHSDECPMPAIKHWLDN